MYNINIGYDSVLVNIIHSNPNTQPTVIYSIPGYDRGDYIHPGLKGKGSDGPHLSSNIFIYSKNQFQEKFDVLFPITLKEDQNNLFDNNFLNQSLEIQRGRDITMLIRSMKVVNVYENTVDYFLERQIPFLYPYNVLNFNFLLEQEIPLPPKKVIEAAKNGMCKIVFFYGHEGHVNSSRYVEKLSTFAKQFTDIEIYFYSSNLIFQKNYTELTKKFPDKFPSNLIFPEYCAFEIDPWFESVDKTDQYAVSYFHYQYFKKLYEHRVVKNFINKDTLKRFLIFNRRPRILRTLIHAAVKSNPELDKNSYVGIGKNPEIINFINNITVKKDSIHRGNEIEKYILDNKSTYEQEGFLLDVDLDINQASDIPYSLYYNSLISVVTETLTDSDSIFFSEKVFKPIIALHPFLILGNPFTLKKLREYGYETFSKYWDESYDLEIDKFKRFSMVLRILEDLNKKPIQELKEMFFDMVPILNKNYTIFLDNRRYVSFLNKLCDFNTSVNKEKII